MKTRTVLVLVALAAALVLSGCMTTFSSENGKLAYAEVSGESVGEVSVEEGYIYIIHPELITFGDKTWENLGTVLEPELEAMDANAISEMSISNGFTGVDFLLSYFVPLVSWGTYQVEGTAVSQ
jgi:ABC-type enterochelin transport system substrate-binding protein